MSNFEDSGRFEFPLGRTHSTEPALVLVAIARCGDGAVTSLSFLAEEHGLFMRDVPERFLGRAYTFRPHPAGPTLYSGRLQDEGLHNDAMLVRGLARREIVGEAASNFIWQLFCDHVLPTTWVAGLDNDFLTDLRAELAA